MKYTAYFIGGPLDGQERILHSPHLTLRVKDTSFEYQRLFAYGQQHKFIYSIYTLDKAMDTLWERYHESTCNNHNDTGLGCE